MAIRRRGGPRSRAEEKASLEEWMDGVRERLDEYPDLHVYHYNA